MRGGGRRGGYPTACHPILPSPPVGVTPTRRTVLHTPAAASGSGDAPYRLAHDRRRPCVRWSCPRPAPAQPHAPNAIPFPTLVLPPTTPPLPPFPTPGPTQYTTTTDRRPPFPTVPVLLAPPAGVTDSPPVVLLPPPRRRRGGTRRRRPLLFRRRPPQSNCLPETVPWPDNGFQG